MNKEEKSVIYWLKQIWEAIVNLTKTPVSQQQADWEEQDNTSPAYIKNKPSISPSSGTIEVEDIEALTDEQIDALKAGDVVVQVSEEGSGGDDMAYTVSVKNDYYIGLLCFDGVNIFMVNYYKDGDNWSCEFFEEQTSAAINVSGTVDNGEFASDEDFQKILETVLNGKKVCYLHYVEDNEDVTDMVVKVKGNTLITFGGVTWSAPENNNQE